MFIQTESTPNPATLKFLPGREVMGEGAVADFPGRAGRGARRWPPPCSRSRKSSRVFFGADFISVTKGDGDWKHLKPAMLGVIMEHFTRGLPLIEGGAEEAEDDLLCEGGDPEVIAQIKELIETRVRPAVAQDGGDIIFKGFDGATGIVFAAYAGLLRRLPVLDHDA